MTSKMPPLNALVFTCTGCNHWQCDAGPRPSRYADTANAAVMLIAEAHAAHLDECVGGTEGRINVLGRWVERPMMQSGAPASGVLAVQLLPRWWVWNRPSNSPANPVPTCRTCQCPIVHGETNEGGRCEDCANDLRREVGA